MGWPVPRYSMHAAYLPTFTSKMTKLCRKICHRWSIWGCTKKPQTILRIGYYRNITKEIDYFLLSKEPGTPCYISSFNEWRHSVSDCYLLISPINQFPWKESLTRKNDERTQCYGCGLIHVNIKRLWSSLHTYGTCMHACIQKMNTNFYADHQLLRSMTSSLLQISSCSWLTAHVAGKSTRMMIRWLVLWLGKPPTGRSALLDWVCLARNFESLWK